MPNAKNRKQKKNAKQTAKKVVKSSVAKRIELKDRVQLSPTSNYMYQNGLTGLQQDSVSAGVVDSLVIVPKMWRDPFLEGPQNGQIIGTEIRPRYLNCKVKINYDLLMKQIFLQGTTPPHNYHNQSYHITAVQGWIKQDLRESMDGAITGGGGWVLPAFPSLPSYDLAEIEIVNREMFNNEMRPEFLTYRQKTESNIKVISKRTIKGDLNSNFIGSSNLNQDGTTGEWRSQDSNMSFNWDLSNLGKTKMSPVEDASGTPYWVLGYNWIPFIQIRCDRERLELIDAVDSTKGRSALHVEHVSHFTYSDS